MKDYIKVALGIIFIILSIVGGFYVGFYLCLFKGIVYLLGIIIDKNSIIVSELAFNIIKTLFFQLFGVLTFLFFGHLDNCQ